MDGQLEYGVDDDFSQFGQLTGAVGGRLTLKQGGQTDSERDALPQFVQALQPGFDVVGVTHQQFVHLKPQVFDADRGHIRPIVQQIIEQYRVGSYSLGEQGRAGHDFSQAFQGRRLLVKQGQIRGAAQDRLQQGGQSGQSDAGTFLRRGAGQQFGHQPIEQLARPR